MKRFLLYIILGVSVAITGCNTSRALTKKAIKLEAAGMTAEAAEKYYWALRKKNTNVDAQIGLKQAGQFVLNKHLSEFVSAKTFGNKETAVNEYLDAVNYYNKVKRIGVSLVFPAQYEADYAEVKNDYLDDLYAEATEYLENENYATAQSVFSKITNLDENYKDASNLQNIAFAEPLYRQGIQALQSEQYRSAYRSFEQILYRMNYKDVIELEDEALTQGAFPIAILPFVNGTTTSGVDATISAYALTALSRIDDPFLKIVDRENLQMILNEQQLGMTGVLNEQSAVQVGEITGAKAILTGTVLSYKVDRGRYYPEEKVGYEKYKVKKTNTDGTTSWITKYKKVKYTQHYGNRSVTLKVQIKLVSLTTGEILFTDIYNSVNEDEVSYVEYKGKKSKLYPAKNDGVNTSNAAYRSLQKKINARKNLKSETELANGLYRDEADFVQRKIERILKQIID